MSENYQTTIHSDERFARQLKQFSSPQTELLLLGSNLSKQARF